MASDDTGISIRSSSRSSRSSIFGSIISSRIGSSSSSRIGVLALVSLFKWLVMILVSVSEIVLELVSVSEIVLGSVSLFVASSWYQQ